MNSNEHMIYLRTNVKPILEPLFIEIGRKKPQDIVQFSIEWLEKNGGGNAGGDGDSDVY